MLSKEENEKLTSVEAGTPMGALMRRYWHPVCMASELVADGAPQRIRLLGETLVLFRDTDGAVGALDEACPHRGASLMLARNERCGLRCLYHGWKIAVDGEVVDTPAEPESSTFKQRVRARAYEVRERGGLIWVHLQFGPGVPDEPPVYEWTDLPESQVFLSRVQEECNWVQALEGVIDSAHASVLHADTFGRAEGMDVPGTFERRDAGTSGALGVDSTDSRPRLETQNTDYGFKYAAIRKPVRDPESNRNVRITHFVAPYTGLFPASGGWGNLQIFVPMDDVTTMQYFIAYKFDGPITETERQELDLEGGSRPGVDIDDSYRKFRTVENNWLQDREAMATGASFSGIEGIGCEDMVVQESMGPIYDRTKENLGTSDVAVIRMRRIMLDAAKEPEAEQVLGLTTDVEALRGIDMVIPHERDWRELGIADVQSGTSA